MLNLEGLKRFEKDAKLLKRILFLEVEWRRSCPDVDLQDQLQWAHYWISTNPKGALYKDMGRYLNNWFKQCQMKENEKRIAERRTNPDRREPPKYVEQVPPEEELMTAEDFERMRKAL